MSDSTAEREPKRLYRSKEERVFFGVCGGIAEYFDIDPVVVRLLMLFAALAFGVGLLFYIIAAFIIPDNPHQQRRTVKGERTGEEDNSRKQGWSMAVGAVLVLFGALLLLDQFHLIGNGWFHFHFFPWRIFWPLLLIGLGVYFVANSATVKHSSTKVKDWVHRNRLHKSRSEKMLAGVCGGVAETLGMDPTIVRLLTAALFFLTGCAPVLIAYIAAAIILPYGEEAAEEHAGNGAS